MRRTRLLAAAAVQFYLIGAGSMANAAPAHREPPVADVGISLVQSDCHADLRRHYLPEYGRRVEHRHRRNCRAVIVENFEEEFDDCHADPQRHYLAEFGRRTWHRHRGERCRVEVLREYQGPRQGAGCFQVGPVTVCP